MSAAAPAGSSDTRMSTFSAASPPRSRARCGRRGRATAPAGCPLRGCRPRRARRPGSSTRARGPWVAAPGKQSARATIERNRHARRGTDLDPREAGCVLVLVGLERERHVLAACARVAANGAVGRHERAGAPAQPRGEPAEEEDPRRPGVRTVADLDRVDVPELVAPARRVERGGHPLAPRRRPQPGEVDHVGVGAQLLRAPQRARGVGLAHGVDQRHLRDVKERVQSLGMPVRRPDDRGEVGHDERVHDRVELGQVLRARPR